MEQDSDLFEPQPKGRAPKAQFQPLPRQAQEDIRRAVEVMNQGGLIVYPTDTIWGIGCDATNPEAVSKVFTLKQRADSKALISLVDSEAKVETYVKDVPDVAWSLIEMCSRPTTIIYDNARNLAPNLMAADGTAAIRITQEAFSKELCKRFRKAMVSTSANISGTPAPQNFSEIAPEILQGVDYVVQYRQNDMQKAQASCIIKLGAKGEVKIIRK